MASLPLKAPSLYATRQKDRKRIEKLWEEFNVNGAEEIEPHDAYLKLLWSDWSRCLKFGVSPSMRKGVILPQDDFQLKLKQGQFLLDLSKSIFTHAKKLLTNVPGILILADDSATILEVVGNADVKDRAERDSNITVGSQWKEECSGTNGIGTAISKKTSVHVFSSEHFCEGWHKWTCAATPILDPFSGNILGVVDFTTVESDFRDSSVALTYALSGQIQQEILIKLSHEHYQLKKFAAQKFGSVDPQSIVICDRFGNVLRRSHREGSKSKEATIEHVGQIPESLKEEVHDVEIKSKSGRVTVGQIFIGKRAADTSVKVSITSSGRLPEKRFDDFITCDEPLIKQLMTLEKVSNAGLSIFLSGETGTGKEVVARYIHKKSKNSAGPFIAVNCGAISKELFESRFFGYEKGAFTGADPKGKRGFFEQAKGGTLFLDEIGELPLEMQAGLLRVLETRKFRRLGSEKEIETECVVLSATNRPLIDAIRDGQFRSDLYFRLNMFSVNLPPLRERAHDIPLLMEHIAQEYTEKNHPALNIRFSDEALSLLQRHTWPGNARELKNTIVSVIALSSTELITPVELREAGLVQVEAKSVGAREGQPESRGLPLRDNGATEREQIIETLRKYETITRVCKELGLSRSTFYRRLHKYGIDQNAYKD